MDSIQFLTRRSATCSDLLSCLYGLKPIEVRVFFQLAGKRFETVDEVSEAVKRDRTTIHRCLSKLVSAGLVYKQVKSLKDGGYYHVYAAMEVPRIKQQAALKVKEVAEGLQNLVDNFDDDFRRCCASC